LLPELAAEVVLVADQRLPRAVSEKLRLDVDQIQQGLAFVGLGAGQGEGDRQAVQG
jgi:hypothetical protein